MILDFVLARNALISQGTIQFSSQCIMSLDPLLHPFESRLYVVDKEYEPHMESPGWADWFCAMKHESLSHAKLRPATTEQ